MKIQTLYILAIPLTCFNFHCTCFNFHCTLGLFYSPTYSPSIALTRTRDMYVRKCDLSQFILQGYELIAQGENCSNKGGLILYVDTKYNYAIKININMFKHWEGMIIEVTYQRLLLF